MAISTILLPSLILVAATIDDLKTRKIHNWLFLTCLAIAIFVTYVQGGIDGLQQGAIGCGTAMLFLMPLVMIKALGAGDLKIMMAFGMATNWNTTMMVIIYSIFCGALLGVLQALLNKEGLVLLKNMFQIIQPHQEADTKKLHKIPYSVALLFGWLTHLSLANTGGLF